MSGEPETKEERDRREALAQAAVQCCRALDAHLGPKGIRFIILLADGDHIGYGATLDRAEATRVILDWSARQAS